MEMSYESTPIESAGEHEAFMQLLAAFDQHAQNGVLPVPDHEGQIVVKEGSEQDIKCQEALSTNHSLFILSHQVGDQKFNQYVVSDQVLA